MVKAGTRWLSAAAQPLRTLLMRWEPLPIVPVPMPYPLSALLSSGRCCSGLTQHQGEAMGKQYLPEWQAVRPASMARRLSHGAQQPAFAQS